MKKQDMTDAEKKAHSRKMEDIALEVGEGAVGAVAGAAIGAVAGPPGAIVGAIIGAAVGAIAGRTGSHEDHLKDDVDQALDKDIGVTSGDIGAPGLEHPPTKSQAFHDAVVRDSQRPKPPEKA
jgi:phage tail tape-measure protein